MQTFLCKLYTNKCHINLFLCLIALYHSWLLLLNICTRFNFLCCRWWREDRKHKWDSVHIFCLYHTKSFSRERWREESRFRKWDKERRNNHSPWMQKGLTMIVFQCNVNFSCGLGDWAEICFSFSHQFLEYFVEDITI